MYYLHYIRCLSCLGEKQRRKNHPNVHVKIVPTVVIVVVAMVEEDMFETTHGRDYLVGAVRWLCDGDNGERLRRERYSTNSCSPNSHVGPTCAKLVTAMIRL